MHSSANNAVWLTKESWKYKAKRKSWRTTTWKMEKFSRNFGRRGKTCENWAPTYLAAKKFASAYFLSAPSAESQRLYKSCMGRANASVAAGRIRRERESVHFTRSSTLSFCAELSVCPRRPRDEHYAREFLHINIWAVQHLQCWMLM